MKKAKKLFIAAVLLIVVSIAITIYLFRESDSTATPSPDGPYSVSVKIARFDFEGRSIPLMIWYPKPDPADDGYIYNTKIKGTAKLEDPALDKNAPYPLIIFSHGIGECGNMSVYFTENLASFGYVVAAPDHKDSAMCHIEGEPDISFMEMSRASTQSFMNLFGTVEILFKDYLDGIKFDFTYRPKEISAVIDHILDWNADSGSFLYKMIDPEKIGMAGHSLGGFTSLAIGGLPFGCGEESGELDCSDANTDLEHIVPCCIDAIRNLPDPLALRDTRVKAILPMGPAVFFPNLEKAATELHIPMMIITGDNKRFEVPWEPIKQLYDNAPAPKYLIRLKDTDHMTIADFLRVRKITTPIYPGYRFNFEDKAQAYMDYSIAFFDLYLKGDNSKSGVLAEPSNRFVELWNQPGK